jgi:hypothetical protein
LSSERTVPFQLRPNKHIDRRLFLEALKKLAHLRSLQEYGYVTLGGAFLEDCRAVYMELGIDRLLSTERDADEFNRQAFNKPLPFIQCCDVAMSTLIADFEDNLALIGSPENIICWLDYQDRDRASQLSDVGKMITKLGAFDVLRVTMNAALGKVAEAERAEPIQGVGRLSQEDALLERSRIELGSFFPEGASRKDFVSEHFPGVLSRAIYSAVRSGLQAGLVAAPITNLVYRDGQQMLTVTVAIWPVGREAELIERAELPSWPFYSQSPTEIHRIEVPTLSTRERTEIDRVLEVSSLAGIGADVLKVFEPGDLEQYSRFRRYYPAYARIAT